MVSPIEIIKFGDDAGVLEMAKAVYGNQEPCFQIDGVTEYDELKAIFGALKQAAPSSFRRHVRFNDAYVLNGPAFGGAHIDTSYQGLAVHQNLTDDVPMVMATAKQWRREFIVPTTPDCFDNPNLVNNVREGVTTPGRLTVFSEGNAGGHTKPYVGLLPTVHYFERPTTQTSRWVRYTTAESWIMHFLLSKGQTARVGKAAKQAFGVLNEL